MDGMIIHPAAEADIDAAAVLVHYYAKLDFTDEGVSFSVHGEAVWPR